jgi:hypothetical protein
VTNLSAGEQAKVDEYIADCKAHLPESSPPAPTPPPSTIVASGTPATTLVSTPVKEPPADSTLVMPRPVQSSHSGRHRRWGCGRCRRCCGHSDVDEDAKRRRSDVQG